VREYSSRILDPGCEAQSGGAAGPLLASLKRMLARLGGPH